MAKPKLNPTDVQRGIITITWSVEDVLSVRPGLTWEQAESVLDACESWHDANTGINWEVIEDHAEDLFPLPDEGLP